MVEQQNWELVGPMYKAEADSLRKELTKVLQAIQTLRFLLKEYKDDYIDLTKNEHEAVLYLLEKTYDE